MVAVHSTENDIIDLIENTAIERIKYYNKLGSEYEAKGNLNKAQQCYSIAYQLTNLAAETSGKVTDYFYKFRH